MNILKQIKSVDKNLLNNFLTFIKLYKSMGKIY